MSRKNSTMEAKRAALSRPNEYRAAELLQWSAAQPRKVSKPIFRKPLPQTVARARIEARYEGRSNVCGSCFQVRAIKSGACGCQ